MKRFSWATWALAVIAVAAIWPGLSYAAKGEAIKWYGIGGEITEPRRWLGRMGLSENLGIEALFAMEHLSQDCVQGGGDCDYTRLDIGVGAIYDVAPGAAVSPYVAGRFIFSMTGDGDSETSGTIETACGVEYVIMERLGLSGELNFSFHTDPTQMVTSTRVRFHFYF